MLQVKYYFRCNDKHLLKIIEFDYSNRMNLPYYFTRFSYTIPIELIYTKLMLFNLYYCEDLYNFGAIITLYFFIITKYYYINYFIITSMLHF